jgi:hypothetical protein
MAVVFYLVSSQAGAAKFDGSLEVNQSSDMRKINFSDLEQAFKDCITSKRRFSVRDIRIDGWVGGLGLRYPFA